MQLPAPSLSALRFLHESGGWLESDPPECRIHHNVLKSFERRGWVDCDRDDLGKVVGCTITKAGHEAYQKKSEGGKPSPDCHGCSFHYSQFVSKTA